MPGPIDDTLKHLTELSPQDWVVQGGWPAARATLIDADIATITGASDKVIRVGGTPDWLLAVDFQAGHDTLAKLGWGVTRGFAERLPTSATVDRVLALWLASTVVIMIVQMALLSMRGQTIGKMAMGLRIIDERDGSNPGFLRAVVLRNLVPSLIGAVPCFGILFVLFDLLSIFTEDRRCIHDWMAGTNVVEV